MRLGIISDTPMYLDDRSELEVYEPTLREIESVSRLFVMINWFGYIEGQNPGNARKPKPSNIKLIKLPRTVGGNKLVEKLKILPALPRLFLSVLRVVKNHDIIHSRGPSVPAFVCIVLSLLYRKKKYWHKYAGNWMEPNPPFMYRIQKWLLLRATNTCVTINGVWPNQPMHIVSLENPSFTEIERDNAILAGSRKAFSGPLTLCFAGLIDASKGVQALLKSFSYMHKPEVGIEKLILAGHGPAMEEVKKLAAGIKVPVEFTGYIQRQELDEIYMKSHVLLLPSRTEGFPKVIAEAASFGCIPVVTDVSSIGQYVLDGINGFLLKDARPESISSALERLLSNQDLRKLSEEAMTMSQLFTYERFTDAIANRVVNNIIE